MKDSANSYAQKCWEAAAANHDRCKKALANLEARQDCPAKSKLIDLYKDMKSACEREFPKLAGQEQPK